MTWRPWAVVAVVTAMALPAPGALAHEGNPDYRSEIDGIEPDAANVDVRILGFDDRLELQNRGNETVVVEGYEGEPYLRFAPDGTVQVNTRSPAYYLNRDRFGESDVPDRADASAAPRWTTAAQEGTYSWHDHRVHYMGRGTPSQVTDEDERTKVFDYRVPIEVDGRPADIAGTLFWAGGDGGFPIAVLAGGAALVVLGAGLVAFLLRRRSAPRRAARPREEAW